MPKYKKGDKILTQKELKQIADNKGFVWVEYRLANPSDKHKEMNEAVVPEATSDGEGFYLGDTCWDNVDDDGEKCFSDGYDGDTLIVYEAVERKKTEYSSDMTTKDLVKSFIKALPEEIVEFIEEEEKMEDFKGELTYLINCVSD